MTTPITKDVEYTTRSGNRARIYATAEETGDRVHGAIDVGDIWVSDSWHPDGSYYKGTEHYNDLIPKPKVRKLDVWLNLDKDGYRDIFGTRNDADRASNLDRIACIHIQRDIVEGEGLE